MIDRWFPCEAVSEAAHQPFGSGRVEKALFTWFAARPIAQARAAVLTTLLPWPDNEEEQRILKTLVTDAVMGKTEALKQAAKKIRESSPGLLRVLDPFSGRGIIPLEIGRAGAEAWGIDYSPVATLAGTLLADFPFRDWSAEPILPFTRRDSATQLSTFTNSRFPRDLRMLLEEIGDRHEQVMDTFYPCNDNGQRPWGYFWAQTIPCDECHNAFPLVGATLLREPDVPKGDLGQSFSIEGDPHSGGFQVILHDGITRAAPTLLSAPGKSGKIGRCSFCGHPHTLDVIKLKGVNGHFRDRLLLVADHQPGVGPVFRLPSKADAEAVTLAEQALAIQPPFSPGLLAVPDEQIPAGNNDTVRGSLYGVRTFGALCNARQTLGYVHLCRITRQMHQELLGAGCSDAYIRALLGCVGSAIVRKLRRSTRGATLQPKLKEVHDVFKNQASLYYSFDYFEAGVGRGAATWRSIITGTINVVEKLTHGAEANSARILQGSALRLPFRPGSIHAIVTDPPYYEMIDYSDATDLFFVWLKRALGGVYPELFDTNGIQDKDEEIIVKRRGTADDHRTRDFYTRSLQRAFNNMRTALRDDGALTLVFGHSDPEAWRLMLSALMEAGFIVTGSWPAKTEAQGGANAATIVTTITIACRTAPTNRADGLQATVDLEIEREIYARMLEWDRDGLAPTDKQMAAYGPAMEVRGRYSRVLRPDGTAVEIDHYLSLARRAVQEAQAIKIDGLPLETFDARTRFALYWARVNGRQLAAKSDALFEAMAANLRLEDVRRDILEDTPKGCRLALFGEYAREPDYSGLDGASKVIDIVRHMVRAWRAGGGEGVATVLTYAERDPDDHYIWAVIGDLARVLPPADPDRKALEDISRNRRAIGATKVVLERQLLDGAPYTLPLFDGDGANGPPPVAGATRRAGGRRTR